MDEPTRAALEAALGYTFRDPALLARSLIHASVAESRVESNERMEFLGDAVLGLIVCNRVYTRFPDLLEGEMTKIKSQAVSRQTCSSLARALGLEQHLRLGRGMLGGGELPGSLGAAAFEAVIAAIYLDGGFQAAERFIVPLLDPLIDQSAGSGHQQNFKSVLQQHAQQTLTQTPIYRVLDEKGPDHAKCFKVCVEIDGRRFPASWGNSKKIAEQAAALHALRKLGAVRDLDNGEVGMVPPEPAAPAEARAEPPPLKPPRRSVKRGAGPRPRKRTTRRKPSP